MAQLFKLQLVKNNFNFFFFSSFLYIYLQKLFFVPKKTILNAIDYTN